MAVQTETYKARVLANYNSLYLILGLKSEGKINIPIYDFLVESKTRFRDYFSDKNLFLDNNLKLEASIAEISKLSESCSFSYISLLDFDSYERIDYLLNLVLAYQDVNSIVDFMETEVKELIEYMTLLERSNGSLFKNTLSYMTIRNFLMLLVNKKFLHASVYATFIKEQIFLSEGLSPKVRFSDLYKGELGVTIMKGRSRYSAKVRRTLKKQVKDIVTNTRDSSENSNSLNTEKSDKPNSMSKTLKRFKSNDEHVEYDSRVVNAKISGNGKNTLEKFRKEVISHMDDDMLDDDIATRPSRVFDKVSNSDDC